jgi:hypothetical protein
MTRSDKLLLESQITAYQFQFWEEEKAGERRRKSGEESEVRRQDPTFHFWSLTFPTLAPKPVPNL